MKILFMGTPEFAAASLRALHESGHELVGVVTQPDKPRGRKMKLSFSPVKEYAIEQGLPVYQPETLRNEAILGLLTELAPELIAVVAYGKLLPGYVLNFPKYGCVNVHGSLLPKYRGAAPIQFAIMNGERETGITTMYMDKGMDTGDMILKEAVPIGEDEDAGSLHDRLMELGARLLVETVRLIGEGKAPREKQDDSEATYATLICKGTCKLDFTKSAAELRNFIRALSPSPGAHAMLGECLYKIYAAELGETLPAPPGTLVPLPDCRFAVACGEGSLIPTNVQLQGCRRMTAKEYLAGHCLAPGCRLE